MVMTVCRRYHELRKNLRRLHERTSEFPHRPDVVVVWARPEIGRLWVFQKLMAEGLIQHLVGRPALPGEVDGVATTHPESHSIRLGLEFVRDHYGADHYAVVQTADIAPRDGQYGFIHGSMQENEAVLYFFANGVIHGDIWHTNFFAVSMDERYWPPLAEKGDQDILERKWGLHLARNGLTSIVRWHNNRNKSFVHCHESEGLPPEPFRPQTVGGGVCLYVRGHRPWWSWFVGWCRSLLRKFRR